MTPEEIKAKVCGCGAALRTCYPFTKRCPECKALKNRNYHKTKSDKFKQMAEENETLRAKLDKTMRCLMAYNEYFAAIADGEYNSNMRPAPLRVFEQLLLDKGRDASKEYRGEEKK